MPAEDLVRMVPILTGRPEDIGPMVAFWGRLGFEVTADFGDGAYVILCSDPTWARPVEVHLSRWDEHDPYRAGSVYLRVQDAAARYARLKAELEAEGLLYLAPATGITPAQTAELRAMDDAGTPYVRLHELVVQEYDQIEFAVIDSAGWLVRVGSPVAP